MWWTPTCRSIWMRFHSALRVINGLAEVGYLAYLSV
jgi:hypothetical protein